MKTLRILHLFTLFVLLFPLIVVFEIIWLFCCIRAAKYLDEPISYGLKVWYGYIVAGILMNKDFVLNGL